MEYKLLKPIKKVTGEILETVTVKDGFTGNDLKKIGNTQGDGSILITIAACAIDMSENYVLNMDARDIKAIAKMAQDFLADGEA